MESSLRSLIEINGLNEDSIVTPTLADALVYAYNIQKQSLRGVHSKMFSETR